MDGGGDNQCSYDVAFWYYVMKVEFYAWFNPSNSAQEDSCEELRDEHVIWIG